MSFSLTPREKRIVLYVLISLIIGGGVKRWREHQREEQTDSAQLEIQTAESD
jgi:hypothetical protein